VIVRACGHPERMFVIGGIGLVGLLIIVLIVVLLLGVLGARRW
jgi:hypothetical protein